jgi:cell division protein FtsL
VVGTEYVFGPKRLVMVMVVIVVVMSVGMIYRYRR